MNMNGASSPTNRTPLMGLAQQLQMEDEIRNLRAQQKIMEAQMHQMRRDMHKMSQRIRNCPTTVEQQAGLMLKANATDVNREFGIVRDELRARTGELFTKEEFEVRLRSKASVEMVLNLVDKVLREVASATGTEQELGTFFRDQRLQVLEAKEKSLEDHMVHMQQERDEEHMKVVRELKIVRAELSKSHEHAQKAARGTTDSIKRIEARVAHLEEARHRVDAVRHIVAAGIDSTDLEVREHSHLLYEAAASSEVSSQSYQQRTQKHRALGQEVGVSGNAPAASGLTPQTPTASHTGARSDRPVGSRRAYDEAMSRYSEKEIQEVVDMSRMTVRERAAHLIQKKVRKRQGNMALMKATSKFTGRVRLKREEEVRLRQQEQAGYQRVAEKEVQRESEERQISAALVRQVSEQAGVDRKGSVSSWGIEPEPPVSLIEVSNVKPATRNDVAEYQPLLGATDDTIFRAPSVRDDGSVIEDDKTTVISSGSIQQEETDLEVLMNTMVALRNRVDALELSEGDGGGISPQGHGHHHRMVRQMEAGLSNLRLGTLEKTVHALAQEQAGICAIGKHTATNLGEVDRRLEVMAQTVVLVLESEAKRLSWDEAQVKALKVRCDEADHNFNDLRTEISRKLNQLRADLKEKMHFVQKKAGQGTTNTSAGGPRAGDDVGMSGKLAEMHKEILRLKGPFEEQVTNLKFETEGVVSELHRHQQLYRDMLSEYMLVVSDLYATRSLSKAELARLREEQVLTIQGQQERILNEPSIASAPWKRPVSRPETSAEVVLHDVLPVLRSVVTNANNGLLSEGASASSLPLDSDYSIEDAQLEVHCEVKRGSGRSFVGELSAKHRGLLRKAHRMYTPGGFSPGEVSGSSIRKRAGAITISAPAFYGGKPRSTTLAAKTRPVDFDFKYIHQRHHVPHRPK
jgi:hypothetical protein